MNTESKQSLKKHTAYSISGFMFVFLILLVTNPTSMPALMMLLLPVLIGLISFHMTRLVLGLFSKLPERQQLLVSSVLATGAVVVVALGSLKQLGFQDLLFTVLLVGGLTFYLKRVAAQA